MFIQLLTSKGIIEFFQCRKKLSIFSTHQDWNHSSNYIAKRYIEDVPMARYFDDVMMQMTTKLWAAHYNHHNPPKKVFT